MRVVVADDDEDLLFLVATRLQRAGYEVDTAEDGVQALELIRSIEPDGCVLDVMMPGMSGIEVARELRTEDRFQQLYIITLTAQDQRAEEALTSGVNDYMTKPFSPRELVARLARGLERGSQPHAES